MGGTQGAIGWWMVKSGLKNDTKKTTHNGTVRVSPYRLATHLLSAFCIYSVLLDTALMMYPSKHKVPCGALPRSFKLLALAATTTVAATIASGAFVAGMRDIPTVIT